jgi:hypothetical protein
MRMRSARGKQDGMHQHRECVHHGELDLETLVWTRCADFPLSHLESQVKCPPCGSRQVVVLFQPPTTSNRQRAAG